jgi:hypothetical protein
MRRHKDIGDHSRPEPRSRTRSTTVTQHPTGPRPSGSLIASPPSTKMSRRWLVVVRAAWVAVALLALAVLLMSIPIRFEALSSMCRSYPCGEVGLGLKDAVALRQLGLSTVFYAAYSVAVESAIAAVFWAVGAVIFWRNSQDKMAVFSQRVALQLARMVRRTHGGVLGHPRQENSYHCQAGDQ